MKKIPIVFEAVSTPVDPFTLRLSKRRARLRSALAERVFRFKKRQPHQRGAHAVGMAARTHRACPACQRVTEPRGHCA